MLPESPQKKCLQSGKKYPICWPHQQGKTRGVSHCDLVIYIKTYVKAKEEWWKFKYFTKQKYNLKKNPVKETKILQDIITL